MTGGLRVFAETLRLRARIALGSLYARGYGVLRQALRAIPPESWTGRGKRKVGAWLRPKGKKKIPFLYRTFAKSYPSARFIQIGANDGVMADPLRPFILEHQWTGVLVEPIPHLFAQLRANYADRPGLKFANVAIAPVRGRRPFYSIRADAPGSQPWWGGLGSFSRDVILRHADRIPGIDGLIVQQEVVCCTFDELLADYGIGAFDLLHIDAEGYDFEILKTVDLTRHRPRLIAYEEHLLSRDDREACRQHLLAHGYETLDDVLDAVAINTRDMTPRDASVRAAWRVLRDTPGYIRA